ncbi:MAG: 1-acyl-sn-glycerol-3-phosphate acyltransferase [Candidatus Aureabacteria bacterium]|nr:1-acyl-sn-glycerol-3-phosphate acyltransferase [Candidatus Auribacterota bacterium]
MKTQVKSVLMACAIVFFMITEAFIAFALLFNPDKIKSTQIRIVSFYSKIALKILRIRLRITHDAAPFQENHSSGVLIIANHLSYLDVLMLASVYPLVFVTSVDLKHDLFLGPLSLIGGSLFVDRKKGLGLKKSINETARLLETGYRIVIFPEATSTNGKVILPFKSALMKAAEIAEVPLIPVCISYTGIQLKNQVMIDTEPVCYYGNDSFFPHLYRILSFDSISAEIHFFQKTYFFSGDRRNTAELCRNMIAERYFDRKNNPFLYSLS